MNTLLVVTFNVLIIVLSILKSFVVNIYIKRFYFVNTIFKKFLEIISCINTS